MNPKEIVIISGKGGTGKTSITGALVALFKKVVIADCDVDAADLHLILSPTLKEQCDFFSGREPSWIEDKCSFCGTCEEMCRFRAITIKNNHIDIDLSSCEGCGVCWNFCPEGAMKPKDRWCGQWMISETRFGPMVHARLGIGAENSGKLVTTVRKKVFEIAQEKGIERIIIDGPPGIGCPVIASITNTHFVIIVTEPTVSGKHDFERVLELVKHFDIPCGLIVNKWDINKTLSEELIEIARSNKANILGNISYDTNYTKAQIQKKTILDIECNAKNELLSIFENLKKLI